MTIWFRWWNSSRVSSACLWMFSKRNMLSSEGHALHRLGETMITRAKADQLEKLAGQLKGIHEELSALAKKSPNDGVNSFKLKFANMVLSQCNELLEANYRPVGALKQFDPDDLPSNSDVTFIFAQY